MQAISDYNQCTSYERPALYRLNYADDGERFEMNAKQIEIGAVYRHRTSSVGYAQAVKVLPPKTPENPTTRVLVKCAWASSPSFNCFMYKHFQPRDLELYSAK